MGVLKIAMAIITGVLIVLLLVTVATFDPEEEFNKALGLYLDGKYGESQVTLSRLKSTLAPMQYYLYDAYIDRALNELEKSSEDLRIAEKDALDHANFSILLEIFLNQSLNAYMANDKEALVAAVKKAMKYGGPNEQWVLVFRGLMYYQAGEYGKALDMWKLDAIRDPLSPWMKNPFEQAFPRYWFVIRIAKSEIETGQTASARVLLESEMLEMTQTQLEESNFLMGYSYVKDASGKDPLVALPLFQLGAPFFEKMPFSSEKYKIEREGIVKQVSINIQHLLESGNENDIAGYLALLDKWGAKNEITQLKAQLLDQFNRAISIGSVENAEQAYAILRLMIPESVERQQLERSLHDLIGRSTLESLEQYARAGKIPLGKEVLEPSSASESIQGDIFDPAKALIPIQTMINTALDDYRINPQFNIERSSDLEKALKALNVFVEKQQQIPQAYVLLGQVRYLLGDFSGSAKAYEMAILLDQRDPLPYRYLALVFEDAHQPQDAILLLLQALKYAPKNADIWEQLADLYVLTGNELDALPSYKEALLIDPLRNELYLSLGRLQVDLEMPEEGSRNLRKYLDVYPDNKEALKLLLLALYNPLLNVDADDLTVLQKQREETYERLHQIDPALAEKIRRSYRPPPAVVSPPPEPEPNLPYLPQ